MTRRSPADRRLTNRARMLHAALCRHDRAIEQATLAYDQAFHALMKIHEETERRFGVDIPRDAMVLDVLDLIVIDGDRWLWQGPRSHHGTPVLRLPRTERTDGGTVTAERTVARWLAVKFDLMAEDDDRQLRVGPNGDPADVNPYNRYLGDRRLGT